MTSKAPRKKESKDRVSSAQKSNAEQSNAPSIVGSTFDKDDKGKKTSRQILPLWPEWTDQDINAEKWDIPHRGKADPKGAGKSPFVHAFDDPEGRIELPSSIKSRIDNWKRPGDFIVDKPPVVVDVESCKEKEFDLVKANEHIANSEFMRLVISQLTAMSKMMIKQEPVPEVKPTGKDTKEGGKEGKDRDKDKKEDKDKTDLQQTDGLWKPWDHIWPKDKNIKGGNFPAHNPGGKYCVKIYWMGTFRKVTVDDTMPFDEEGNLLLPATPRTHELWPMLLTKALLKVAALDYTGGSSSSEFGDMTVIQCLTGWLPEIIPLRYGHSGQIWNLLLEALPKWKLQEPPCPATEPPADSAGTEHKTGSGSLTGSNTQPPPSAAPPQTEEKKKEEKPEKKTKGDKGDKEGKIKDKDSKEKAGANAVSGSLGSFEQPKEPEFVIFASYSNPPSAPVRISYLREMADASEKLRQSGLSHNHPHPVLVTMVRNCPLVAPPVPIPIPRWKLIRQKKKKNPVEPPLTLAEPPKEPKFLQITSPLVNYCVSPIPVSRARTPRKWVKYKPEKPMGEIVEEGDKPEEDQVEGDLTLESVEATPVTSQECVSQDTATSPEISPKVSEPKVKESSSKEEKDSGKSKSSKSDDQLKVDKPERVKSGTNRSEKQERVKSGKDGSPQRSKNRKMSKMDRPDSRDKLQSGEGTPVSPGSRRMSKAEKPVLESKGSKGSKDLMIPEIVEESIETSASLEAPSVGDGDTAPSEGAPTEGEGEGDAEKTDDAKTETCDESENENKEKTLWMEYEDFCKCFEKLYIFHKPGTYTFTKQHSEVKNLEERHLAMHPTIQGGENVPTTAHPSKKSGLGPAASLTQAATPIPGKGAPSPAPYQAYSHSPLSQDAPPPYLFVDSLKPVEIVVSFSSFSKWVEPMPLPQTSHKEKDSSSTITEIKEEEKKPTTPGLLIAEPYSWKSLVTGQPILRIKTTGTKAAMLQLPAGRHVLRFLLQAPLGYHVDLCSQTPFVYGDEDTVMSCLTKESCRFVDHALRVMQNVGLLVMSFNEPCLHARPEIDLGLIADSKKIQEEHFVAFMKCLFATLQETLDDQYTQDMRFAWRALHYVASLCQKLKKTKRPLSADDITRIGSGVLKADSAEDAGKSMSVPPTSLERAPLTTEEMAAVTIQSSFRGHLTRKLHRSYTIGTSENQLVVEQLSKSWGILEPILESFAVKLFRRMFREDPGLFPLFPFYQDEWTRVAYTDYSGSYPEQPPHTWFVVFREVFYVSERVLAVPKLYINIPTCLLRVIDNDTGEELPRVFQRVTPQLMEPNKGGYTLVAEARSPGSIQPAGKFRLRIIGSSEPLPVPYKDSINTHFSTRELRDYYVPNKYKIIFRHTVKTPEDRTVSLQLGTSKHDVYIKLQILDHEQEVACTTGKGHAVIPSFTFMRDRTGDEEERGSRRGSRPPTGGRSASGRQPTSGSKRPGSSGSKGTVSKKGGAGRRESANSTRSGTSIKGSQELLPTKSEERLQDSSSSDNEGEPEVKIHKYIIQAQVLHDSWPLSRSAWNFVALLKNLEKGEDAPPTESTGRGEKLSASTTQKGKKGKDTSKDGRSSKGQSGSRPASQQFDSSKPNWILRLVCDSGADDLEVKKDIERQEEIKAMKQAWESAEPGRSAKAQQSRMKFLSEHTIKLEKESNDEETGDEETDFAPSELNAPSPAQSDGEGELTLEPPPKEPDQVLAPFDITPFIRSSGTPVLLDDAEAERRQALRQEQFREYKNNREQVEKRREQDRLDRNAAKERQLQLAEEWQAALDKFRQEINLPREAYRQKFLDAERLKEEAAAAEAARERSPSPGKGRKSARKSAGKDSKGGKKTPVKGKKK